MEDSCPEVTKTLQNWLDDYLWLLWGASQEEDDVADAADARLRANAVEDCILFLAVGSRLLFCEFLSLWAAAASPIFDALLSLLLPLRLKVPGQQRKKGESWGRVCDVIPTNTYNRTWALLKHFSLLFFKAQMLKRQHMAVSLVRMLYNIRSVE